MIEDCSGEISLNYESGRAAATLNELESNEPFSRNENYKMNTEFLNSYARLAV